MAKTFPHLLSSLFLVFLVFVVVGGGGGGGGVSVGALFALLVCKVQKASAFQVFYKFQNTIRYNKRAL